MSMAAQEDIETALKKHEGLIYKTLRIHFPRCFYGAEFEDYVSMGRVGLWKALQTWDENAEASFSSWAIIQIRGAIVTGLRPYGHSARKHLKGRWNHSCISDCMPEDSESNPYDLGFGGVTYDEAYDEKDRKLKLLEQFLSAFSPRDRTILLEHAAGKSFKKIAKHLPISSPRVAQIYQDAMRLLRARAKQKREEL
jgi:RNA polymerase sigma factor, sigma-70 family